jgi:hypothetical protein
VKDYLVEDGKKNTWDSTQVQNYVEIGDAETGEIVGFMSGGVIDLCMYLLFL